MKSSTYNVPGKEWGKIMREIKFRAWDKTAEKMLYFFGIFNERPYTERSTFPQKESYPEYHELEIMNWTGLRDKNGKEIYEGDVVKAWHPDHNYFYIGSIEYDVEQSAWFLSRTGYISLPLFHYDEFEIIGNIYENPELLHQ